MSRSVTTLAFHRFPLLLRPWAMSQMALARPTLSRTRGLRFYKLLGSGSGSHGVSPRPDFSTWAVLGVWDDAADAEAFRFSTLAAALCSNASESWTVTLEARRARGRWSGVEPFGDLLEATPIDGPVAVLTRASIRRSLVPRFWSHVPDVNASMQGARGLLFSKGIGELPLVEQATFSVWSSMDAMRAFAYESDAHRNVITRTRELGWYSEELFARFVPVETDGTWEGRDPLAGHLAQSR